MTDLEELTPSEIRDVLPDALAALQEMIGGLTQEMRTTIARGLTDLDAIRLSDAVEMVLRILYRPSGYAARPERHPRIGVQAGGR
jgi:hypothetical protein